MNKSQTKGVQKKKMIDTLCENNINTIAEELVLLEDIGTYILMILLSMMDEVPIASTLNNKTVDIQEVVLSEASKLNELLMDKK